MKVIDPYVVVSKDDIAADLLTKVEAYARVCYKSEDKIIEDRANSSKFVRGIIRSGHESTIEHEKITVKFIVDRGVSHELVRHRIASFSQESTRYCSYSGDKFGNEITVIKPFFFFSNPDPDRYEEWYKAMYNAEMSYMSLTAMGASAQEARSVLPNSLKTEVVTTFNLREWRHFFRLRAAAPAHPQMRQVAIPLLLIFQKYHPEFFDDIDYDRNFLEDNYSEIKIERLGR